MGYYIFVPQERMTDKAGYLVAACGAKRLSWQPKWEDIPEDKSLICVIKNPSWDAAVHVFCQEEYSRASATSFDTRPRVWLYMDRQLAREASGLKKDMDKRIWRPGEVK